MNIPRLTQLADYLEQSTPDQFNFQYWFGDVPGHELPDRELTVATLATINPKCGTCGCIAGDAILLFGRDRTFDMWNIPEVAADLLGIEMWTAGLLFQPLRGWRFPQEHPDPTTLGGRDRGTITAQEAATTIRKLIETQEVDWSHVHPVPDATS